MEKHPKKIDQLTKIKTYLTSEIKSCDSQQFYGEPEDVIEDYAKNEGRRDAFQEILDFLNNNSL